MTEVCGPGKEFSSSKNKPAAFFGSPLPLPALSSPPRQQRLPGKAAAGREQGGRELAALLSDPEKEREREGEDKREGERDGLIWEHRQTICGNGLEGSRGQIPDRWKKLNMGQSRFWAQKKALVSQ